MTTDDASGHATDASALDTAAGVPAVGGPAVDAGRQRGADEDRTARDTTGTAAGAPSDAAGDVPPDPADRWAATFERPALIAALAAIPATFLTLAEGTWATTGEVVNILSAIVLVAEGVVLFVASRDRRRWVKRNWWLLATIAIVIPATIFAVGPAQLLRLVRSLGALRVLRVRRIIKAGKVASARLGLTARWRKVVVAVISLASAAFVAVVLADPSGMEVDWMRDLASSVGTVGVLIAGALLGVATYLVVRDREDEDEDGSDAGGEPAGPDGSAETDA